MVGEGGDCAISDSMQPCIGHPLWPLADSCTWSTRGRDSYETSLLPRRSLGLNTRLEALFSEFAAVWSDPSLWAGPLREVCIMGRLRNVRRGVKDGWRPTSNT